MKSSKWCELLHLMKVIFEQNYFNGDEFITESFSIYN